MATLTLDFTPPSTPPANGYVVKYRVKGTTGPYTTVTPNRTTVPIVITGLVAHTNYEGVIQSDCGGGLTSTVVAWSSNNSYVTYWAKKDYVCEQDSVYTLAQTLSGFSSPALLMYDPTSGKVFGVDQDDTSGNFFSFNPSAVTSRSSLTFYTGSKDQIYVFAADQQYRRLYAAGKNTSGLKVLDIATLTVSTKAYGMNDTGNTVSGNGFNRLGLTVLSDRIICYDDYTQAITLFNRDDLTQIGSSLPIASIPSGSLYLQAAAHYHQVGTEIWVVPSQSDGSGNIARYNNTFTTLLGTIDLTSSGLTYKSLPWDYGKYWRSSFYDQDNNTLYVHDSGSNYYLVIDTTTRAVIYSKKITNLQVYTNSSFVFLQDPITNDLYMSGRVLNSTVSGYTLRSYQLDRSNYSIINVFPSVSYLNLIQITGTNTLYGAQPNNTQWQGGSWDSDGLIYKYIK